MDFSNPMNVGLIFLSLFFVIGILAKGKRLRSNDDPEDYREFRPKRMRYPHPLAYPDEEEEERIDKKAG